jgi:predicted metal-binding protein
MIRPIAETHLPDGNTVVTVACMGGCDKPHEVHVDTSAYLAYKAGELAQRAFPTMSADQRELLISGTCGTCWNEMFPPEEEED